jgi:hypothetical protein
LTRETFRRILERSAGVAELADARDSNSREGDLLWVRFPPPAWSSIILALAVLPKSGKHARAEGWLSRGWSLAKGVAFCFVCETCRIEARLRSPGFSDSPRVRKKVHATRTRRKRRGVGAWLAIIGLLCGIGLGLWYGWVVNPVEYTDTDIAYLQPAYRDELLVMIGEAYALDGNLDVARARLALLSLPDPSNAVADAAERAIAENRPLAQVRALVQLAHGLGVERDAFRPFQLQPEGAQ